MLIAFARVEFLRPITQLVRMFFRRSYQMGKRHLRLLDTERPDLLRVEQVMQRLQVGETMVHKLINSGELRHVRIGRAVRVPVQAIEEFISRVQVGG